MKKINYTLLVGAIFVTLPLCSCLGLLSWLSIKYPIAREVILGSSLICVLVCMFVVGVMLLLDNERHA